MVKLPLASFLFLASPCLTYLQNQRVPEITVRNTEPRKVKGLTTDHKAK